MYMPQASRRRLSAERAGAFLRRAALALEPSGHGDLLERILGGGPGDLETNLREVAGVDLAGRLLEGYLRGGSHRRRNEHDQTQGTEESSSKPHRDISTVASAVIHHGLPNHFDLAQRIPAIVGTSLDSESHDRPLNRFADHRNRDGVCHRGQDHRARQWYPPPAQLHRAASPSAP